jgi:outer membrane protein TolC
LTLASCQSALGPDYAAGSERYYQSLVAREIIGGTYGAQVLATPATLAGGVREIVRVDTAGPDPTTATAPTTGPSLANVSVIGYSSATLRKDEPVVGLSLQDAIARTVQHSLAIKVEAYNPAIKESLIVQAMANFDPTVFGQSQWSSNDDPQISPNFNNGQNWQNQLGVRRLLPIGTQIQASTGFNLHDTYVPLILSKTAPQPKSYYTSNINLQLTQPLLKGFGADVNQANIYLAQRDLRISQAAFRQQVMTSVADVEDAYQNLILTRTNVDVLEHLVVASEQTYNDVLARKNIDATTASINQALSALESRRADLHVAQKIFRDQSDKLKALINDPELDINSNVLINPTDRPISDPVNYELLDCVETALRQRPELQQARLQLERADIVIRVARNALLPQVDLTLALQSTGLDNGLDQSYTRTVDPMSNLDASVGIKFEIPLGNRDAEYKLRQHVAERNQAITSLVQGAQKVVQDVKAQLREVYSSYEEIADRDRVREAAANEFQGIIDLENIRPRTPEFLQLKLDSQARLAQAQQQLTQVIINYNLAIMRLEQSKGTLLEFDRISLDKAPKPAPNPVLDGMRLPGKSILAP